MSESAKYAGYVRRDTPIDWSQVASDVVDKLGDIQKDKAAFREKNDKLAADAIATVSKYEAGQNPQLNQMAYDMIADGRSTISALHDKLKRREISPDAYNRALMSMTQQNNTFKEVISTYNADLETLNKGLADGTLGSGSAWVADKLSNLADLRDKKFQWVPDRNGMTNLYVTSVDEDGNMVKEPMSMNSVKDLGKTEFKKYNLEGNIDKLLKGMETYTDPSGRIKDVRENPKYQDAKQATIKVAVTGDDQALSILTDYGDYKIYGEGDEVPDKGVKMVLNTNGVYVPEITPELREAAKKIVDDSIEGRVGRVVTPYTPRTTKTPTPKFKPEDEKMFKTGYQITREASIGNFAGMDRVNYKFEMTPDGKGINVYKIRPEKGSGKGMTKQPLNEKPLEVGTRETQRILSKYTKEFGNQPQSKWDYIDETLEKNSKGDIAVDIIRGYNPNQEELDDISKIYSKNMDVSFTVTDSDKKDAKKSLREFLKNKVGTDKLTIESSDLGLSVKIDGVEVSEIDLKDDSEETVIQKIKDIVNKSKGVSDLEIQKRFDNVAQKVDLFGNPI